MDSVVSLEVREFVVRFLTAEIGAAERLLSRDARRRMKDICSNCHLWKNHRTLDGRVEAEEGSGPLRALTVCVLALDEDLLFLGVAGGGRGSPHLQTAESGKFRISLSRLPPFPGILLVVVLLFLLVLSEPAVLIGCKMFAKSFRILKKFQTSIKCLISVESLLVIMSTHCALCLVARTNMYGVKSV